MVLGAPATLGGGVKGGYLRVDCGGTWSEIEGEDGREDGLYV